MSNASTDSHLSNTKPSLDSTAPQLVEKAVSKLQYEGEADEIVIIDNKKYYRHELMKAFGGTLNPGLAPYPVHQFANASAVGLAGFALTTFVLGLYLSSAMGVTTPNVVVSLCMFYGGAVQFLAGVWEMVIGNTFAATAFCGYGAFWMSWGSQSIPAFGISAAYADEPEQLQQAIGFILLGWGIFTFLMVLCTLKATLFFFLLFFLLDVAFFLLAASQFTGSTKCGLAGGIFAVLSAFCGWYLTFAGVATKQNSYLIAHPIQLPVFQNGRFTR